MAEITRTAQPSVDTVSAVYAMQIAGNLFAGEDIEAGSMCRVGSDGLVYKSNATAANANAQVDGVAPKNYTAGQPVTLFGVGIQVYYADATLTPGTTLFLSDTVDGGLADVATTGDASGVARAINASTIRLIRFN